MMSPIPFRTRNGVDCAQCHGCRRWRPWDDGRLVAVHASSLPLDWPLGFKVFVCGDRCARKVAA